MEEYKQTDTEMSVVPATAAATINENVQTGLPKNMVPDPGCCRLEILELVPRLNLIPG